MTPTTTTAQRCRHCGDDLPEDCPDTVTSCRGYSAWQARQTIGLDATDVHRLELLPAFCSVHVAIRDGLETLPELPV